MRIEWNLKTILIWAGVAVLFIGTNIGQYYMIWKPKMEEMKLTYETRISVLEAELDRIGPLVNIWTVGDGVTDLYAGREIQMQDLVQRELPESFVTQSLVLNPETIIGKYYRIGLLPGTPLSMDLVMEDPVDDTVREFDVVASVMPIGLKVGDYIDFRLIYPRGEDYIVLPHKRVEAINDNTIKLKLNETEIHYYQAALIDYFLQSKMGASIYLSKYLEPGMQQPAEAYYAVPENILAIMAADPNLMPKVNAAINNTARDLIDAGRFDIDVLEASLIAAGRSEVTGKIDTGKTKYENAEKERQEMIDRLGEVQAQEPSATDGTSSANNSSGTSSSSSSSGTGTSTPSGNPLLEIEKGVVE
ncbi:hypothetical protein D3P09_16810 [Paenibacillus pinisoli]|uniref:SAF domain-containing protein n=1 Tax=Paenibacillus pinisoli TaxID=1276110 RepID=A0A3A6PTT7_9BACL|nr:SAF domain-containing protein [Paenibacillus pinisoli]RJX39153.1 hypothetical protein D3P09_16810 [Paenibacillus pinisoli]